MADDIGVNAIISTVIGAAILLVTGVFVSAFIGNRLILTGLRGEKKLAEQTDEEIRTEEYRLEQMENTLERMDKELSSIENEIEQHHTHKK